MTALDVSLVVPFLVDPNNAHLNGVGAVTRSEPGADIESLEVFHKVAIGLTDERSVAITAFQKQRPVTVENVMEETHAKHWLARLTGTRSAMAVPVVRDEESIGVIVVGDSRLRQFTDEEIATASEWASRLEKEWSRR